MRSDKRSDEREEGKQDWWPFRATHDDCLFEPNLFAQFDAQSYKRGIKHTDEVQDVFFDEHMIEGNTVKEFDG